MILNNKLLLNGILAFSILSLSIAYFIQYVLGHKPCNLCIIERVPYIAAIILISLIFILNNKLLLNGILAFSILSLSIAYFIQYVLGHKPCNLCIIERIPYIAAIILISLIFILNRYQKIISSLILIFFIFGAVVSFYHFGIEQGFFSESLVCDLGNSQPINKKELLNQLKKAEIVSCKDVTFRFLGLSLATINTVISLILSGIMIKVIKNYGKN